MLTSFSRTDIGSTRKLNQDYIYTTQDKIGNLTNLFIVADGMGGHAAGDYASRTAVQTIVKCIEGSFFKRKAGNTSGKKREKTDFIYIVYCFFGGMKTVGIIRITAEHYPFAVDISHLITAFREYIMILTSVFNNYNKKSAILDKNFEFDYNSVKLRGVSPDCEII